MTKKDTTKESEQSKNEETQTFESEDYTKERPKRRKVYERVREAQIPDYVRKLFLEKGYHLRLVRWGIRGEVDYRYLSRQEQEGYDFVLKDELPSEYLRTLRVRDTDISKGMVTNGGDLCLMKMDIDLLKSRQDYYEDLARQELNAVDIHVLEKKHGLRNTGSKSQIMHREPSFQD